ncbi:MAG: protoheme IX farnesyltransferase [Saprospiraceae bacterium]|jgi:heme o synthase|nr:protoheme IX farnesyltransferase [Saprospiraceae bacterium]
MLLEKFNDYVMLTKLRLTLVVVFSSMIGYLIVAGSNFLLYDLLLLLTGGFLVTASANTLNQVLEKDFDINMSRTANRPLAAGRMKTSEAVMFAGLACLVGISILALFNPITALLGMLSLITYSFVYTPLKRFSTAAVAVGAIPGALPVMIGCTAFDGKITFLALGLFVIQFLWQFPHFWSIGFLGFEDYKRAGFKLLPEINGEIDRKLGLISAIYGLMIVPVIYVLYTFSLVSIYSTLLVFIFTLIYIVLCFSFNRSFNRKSAMVLMFYSFFYLPFVLLSYWLI